MPAFGNYFNDLLGYTDEASARGQGGAPALGYVPATRADLAARDAAARAGEGTYSYLDANNQRQTLTGSQFRSSADPLVMADRQSMLSGPYSDPNLLFGSADGRQMSADERAYRSAHRRFMENPNSGVDTQEALTSLAIAGAIALGGGYLAGQAAGAGAAGAAAAPASGSIGSGIASGVGSGFSSGVGTAVGSTAAGATQGLTAAAGGIGAGFGTNPGGMGVFANNGAGGLTGVGGGNAGALASSGGITGGAGTGVAGSMGGGSGLLSQDSIRTAGRLAGAANQGGAQQAAPAVPFGSMFGSRPAMGAQPSYAPITRPILPGIPTMKPEEFGRRPYNFAGATIWR